MTVGALRVEVKEFETIIQEALRQKYAGQPAAVIEHVMALFPVRRWDLLKLYDAYLQTERFPADRLPSLVRHLFDVKLQLYFLLEVDAGLQNRLVWDRGYQHEAPREKPHLLLTRLSLEQTMIVKSRILWERIMNCIYYLATGEDLEGKKSSKRSKRAAFFAWIVQAPEWRWLEPYEARLQEYEDRLRTPEMHKWSVLRAELMGKRPRCDLNETGSLLNLAINCIWENLLSIVSGGKAVSFSDLHTGPDGGLDSRYLK